ncbi:MAG TPA: histidine kinase [Bacteroidia bacterium]
MQVWCFSQAPGYLVEESLRLKTPFTITQYSTKQGLPQSQVIDIVSRNNGALIISTANGIVEFNGTNFKEFIPDPSYKKHIYSDLFWNEKNQVLIGRGKNGNPYLLYPSFKLLGEYSGFNVIKDSLYCINKEGELFGTNLTKIVLKPLFKTGLQSAECLYNSPNGFYLSDINGFYEFNLQTKTSKKINDAILNKIVYSDVTKKSYGITDLGILELSDQPKQIFSLSKPNTAHVCLDIEFVDSSDFYVSTTNGLYEMLDGDLIYYSAKSGLPSVFLHSLVYDKSEECLFVGTGNKGLLKLPFKSCYSYSVDEGFDPAASLSSVIQTENDGVLVGESGGQLYQVGLDTVYHYINFTNTYSSLAEVDGLIYAGSWGGGVRVIKNKKLIDSICFPHIPNNNVHGIYTDKQGVTWFGTSNGIAKGKTISETKPFLTDKITDHVICFYELSNGNLCIGGANGVFILDNNRRIITHLNNADGLQGREVRCFYEDEEKKLWIGTYDGGLYCFEKNKLTRINDLPNCQLNRDVFCLAEDEYGYIYMTSNHGLWRIKKTDLDDFYKGNLDYLVPFQYTEEAGILNTEFNGGFQNNFLRSGAGHFYFPALQGIVVVMPEEPVARKLTPCIDRIFINDTLIDTTMHTFSRETYSIQLNFSCVNFSAKNNIYYQYRLEGEKNTEWSNLQKSNIINFKILPPGKYTVCIRAISAINDKNPTIAKYAFEIKPYFYETFWFKVFVVFFIVSKIILGIYLWFRNDRKKQIEKERINKKIAGLELNVLLAQMNPHFIFNSLNSLKYFLNVNDIKRADEFIDHFSFLLRKVMIYSSETFISLEEETQLLRAYIELEKIRLNDKFTFEIKVDPALYSKLIPTFILQPFVENAIKHGFGNSEQQCKLYIDFAYENKSIICTIDDDGVGREIAGSYKSLSILHESKGIANVLERIAIKKESYGKEISIKIIDKKDSNGRPGGTTVIVTIEEI